MVHRFGRFEFDETRFELRRNDRAVPLEPRVTDLLAYFLHNPDRLIGYDELVREVWHGATVTRSALAFAVSALRRVLRDDRPGAFLKTVRGRGYRWVAATTGRSPGLDPTPEHRLRLALVGRVRELDDLDLAWEQSRAGRGCVTLIAGEPGIGKTRLVEEHAERARRRGASVIIGRCPEPNHAPDFWPWIQVVRAAVEASDPKSAPAALRGWCADLAATAHSLTTAADGAAHPGSHLGAARFELFDIVARFLIGFSRRRPLVLALEDLHAADVASLHLLEFFGRSASDAQISVLATYRSTESQPGSALSRTVAVLLRSPSTRVLEIGPLGLEDVHRLVDMTAGREAAARGAQAIFDWTDGHPLFVTEIVRLLASNRWLPLAETHRDEAAIIPNSLRDAIRARFDDVSEACRHLLEQASVLGRDVDPALLRPPGEDPGAPQRHAAVGEAIAARLLETTGSGGQLRFCHELVREAIYAAIPPWRREQLHFWAGCAVASRADYRADTAAADVARHWLLAGPLADPQRVVDACEAAARRAVSALAFEAALAHYARAVEVLEQRARGHLERRCDLLLEHGALAAQLGEDSRARTSLEYALALARELCSPERIARAAIADPALRSPMIEPAREAAVIEEALRGLPPSPLRVELLARLSTLLHWSPSQTRRIEASEQAVAMARTLGDPRCLGRALIASHLTQWTPDRVVERIAIATEMQRLAIASGDAELLAFSYQAQTVAFLETGERNAFRRELDGARRLLARTPKPLLSSYRCWLALVEGALAFSGGRFQEAERWVEDARELARFERPEVMHWSGRLLFSIRREQGRLGELDAFLPLLQKQDHPIHAWRAALVLLHGAAGRSGAAAEEFSLLAGGDWIDRHDATWLPTMALMAQVAALARDRTRAAELIEHLRPYADRLLVLQQAIGTFGSVARHLGLLNASLGSWAAAERDYERAIEIESRWDAALWRTQAQCALAVVLLARGTASDRTRAAALLSEGREAAQQIGLVPLLWLTREALRAESASPALSGSSPRRGSTNPKHTLERNRDASA